MNPAFDLLITGAHLATMAGEAIMPLKDKSDEAAPYFSMILVPGRGRRP